MADIEIDEKKSGSVSEKVIDTEEQQHVKDVDAAADLVEGFEGEVDPEEAKRVLRKIDWHLLPLMMVLYLVQFADKTTLNQANNLGMRKDVDLSATEYNWLSTVFYLSYLALELPQSWALQKFHVGKWMAGNVLVWGIALFCHAASHNFAGLLVVRIILGICEGSITAGFLIVSTQFYRSEEAARRIGFWFLIGSAQIVSGLLSYAILHSKISLEPWRILFILWGSITMVVGICYAFFCPSSPTDAKFFTARERIIAIERVRQNNESFNASTTKTWKREQFVECLLDWKTWAFFLFAAVNNIPNSLTNQASAIIKSLGFTTLQTTLLGCVSGAIEIITIYTGTLCIKKWNNGRAVIGAVYFIPNILGSALILGLPYSNKAGQLCAYYITGVGTTGFVLALSWVSSVTKGATKARTTNAIMLVGYCLGNLVAPQMWLAKYAPRNVVPWIVILVSYSVCPLLMLGIAWALRRENRRRDALPNRGHLAEEFCYVDEVQADGSVVAKRIPREFLDLTDRQDLAFRYPL